MEGVRIHLCGVEQSYCLKINSAVMVVADSLSTSERA